MRSFVRDPWCAIMVVPVGAALLLLVTIALLVRAEPLPGIAGGRSSEAPASPLATGALSTTFPADGWVYGFTDAWAPDGSTDAEGYLELVRSGSILPVQLTNDEGDAGPPALAEHPRETIVAVWAGPSQTNEYGEWNNIEYATFDASGTPILPITQLSNDEPRSYWGQYFVEDPVAAVAPTSGNVLFAWSQFIHLGPGASWTEIYYAVRGPDGTEIKGPGLITSTIAYAEEVSDPAAAAFANGSFLLAWCDAPVGGVDDALEDIYYSILDATGDVLAGPTNLTGNPAGQYDGDVRATGLASGHVLLTWTGRHGLGPQIYYAVLDGTGGVIQAPTRLSDAPYGASSPDAAGLFNGSIIVAWQAQGAQAGESQIAYAMIDRTYAPALPLPVGTTYLTNPLEPENESVCIARDRSGQAVLTWRDGDEQQLYAAVVGNDGQVRTYPQILRTARGERLYTDWTGAGCGSLPVPLSPSQYLPLVARNK
jgi:hypothetical protein